MELRAKGQSQHAELFTLMRLAQICGETLDDVAVLEVLPILCLLAQPAKNGSCPDN